MKRSTTIATCALAAAVGILQISVHGMTQNPAGWTVLFDGTNLNAWNTIGNANWKLGECLIEASTGNGFLVSKESYTDFEVKVEFWVDDAANSGVFIRCENPMQIDANNAYEVNIYDKRPDQTYRTGAIVEVSKPSSTINTGGAWNTFLITARGTHLTVVLNNTRTVDGEQPPRPRSHRVAIWRSRVGKVSASGNSAVVGTGRNGQWLIVNS